MSVATQRRTEIRYAAIYKNIAHLFNCVKAGKIKLNENEWAFLEKCILAEFWTDTMAYHARRLVARYFEQLPGWPSGLRDMQTMPVPSGMIKQQAGQTKNDRVIFYQRGRFHIQFGYRPQIVDWVKQISGRAYDKTNKMWSAPPGSALEVNQLAQKWDFAIEHQAQEVINQALKAEISTRTPITDLAPHDYGDVPPDIYSPQLKNVTLRPYQVIGVSFAIKNRKIINADEMGLGKTLQSIAAVHCSGASAFPCLVVCPASLKINWLSEWRRFTNRRVSILDETGNPEHIASYVDVVIVNYERLKKVQNLVGVVKSVIVDECHRVKNPKIARYKNLKPFGDSNLEFMLMLTGTPILNKVGELVPLLQLCDVIKKFGGSSVFEVQYNTKNIEKLNELQKRLRETVMIRRLKSEVAKDLPDRMRQMIEIELPPKFREEYVFCRDRFTEYIVTQKDYTFEKANNVSMVEHLVKISFLKKISALGKVTAAIDFANEIVEQGLKIVVFAHHKEVIDQLMTGLAPNGVVKIDGGTRSEARNAAVQAFQHDPKTMAIVLSLNAASEGLTLTVASTMLFVEYPWTPGQFDQAEARCHRIGQSAQSVNIYNAVGKNTVDYHILNIIAEKRDVFNAAIGSDNDGTMQLGQGDIVKELIRRMNQEKISSQ